MSSSFIAALFVVEIILGVLSTVFGLLDELEIVFGLGLGLLFSPMLVILYIFLHHNQLGKRVYEHFGIYFVMSLIGVVISGAFLIVEGSAKFIFGLSLAYLISSIAACLVVKLSYPIVEESKV